MIKKADKQSRNKQVFEKDEVIKPIVTECYWTKLKTWHKKNGRHSLPWRKNRTAWSILVAEVLLRRTRADTVSRVFPVIISKFPDADTVLNNRDIFIELTSELGFPSRFEQFFETCSIIMQEYSGSIPLEGKQLISLPGIGHYSSDAIRCFGFGQRRYLVDPNTLRISSRLTGAHIGQEQHRSLAARFLLNKAFGPEKKMTANHNFALLDLAAVVCKPSNPNCGTCPLLDICNYGMKGSR